MVKKNFSTAGMDILGLRQQEEADPTFDAETAFVSPESEPLLEEQKKEAAERLTGKMSSIESIEKKSAWENVQPEKLVRKSYYVTHDQHRALKIKAANSERKEEKDISAIIRMAIDMYLARK